jgi:hypothetical protein
MNTLLDETIHIMVGCAVHLHWNKNVPFMKPFILMDLSNGTKFRNYTCWSTNDTHSHRLSCQVSNHHINNKDLVLTNHVEISS